MYLLLIYILIFMSQYWRLIKCLSLLISLWWCIIWIPLLLITQGLLLELSKFHRFVLLIHLLILLDWVLHIRVELKLEWLLLLLIS
jgi:hypothetical protein